MTDILCVEILYICLAIWEDSVDYWDFHFSHIIHALFLLHYVISQEEAFLSEKYGTAIM